MFNKPTTLRSVLAPNYLEYCLSNLYGNGDWLDCLFWLRGLNDTYKIRTQKGHYILRIYRKEIGVKEVDYELSLLTHLNNEMSSVSTKVSVPIAKKDGRLYSTINAPEGDRIAVMFNYITGIENMLHDEQSNFLFGKSAAELHTAMDNISLNHTRNNLDTSFLVTQPLERIVNYIGEKNSATPFLREFSAALIEKINNSSSKGLDWGLIHGDMHGNNNAFQVGESYTHYDFEYSAMGWRAYDLAQVKHRKRLSHEMKEPLWQALISGYRSVRDFSEKDEATVDLFLVARRLWVMNLDVEFVNDTGVLDFSEHWLEEFINEFRSYNIV